MLIKIKITGAKEDLSRKIDQMNRDDRVWLAAKYGGRAKVKAIEMDLSEVIRLLTAFNNIEKIYFDVR